MLKTLSLVTVGATVMALGAITQAEAAQIIQPQSASTDMGESSIFIIDNAINQSGLSATYTSGVTDFDTYVSGNPTNGFVGSWISTMGTTAGSVTFDLGNVFGLDGMAMWGSVNNFSVQNFDLFASLTGAEGSFVSLGSFVQDLELGDDPAQVFNFNATTAQFIRMDIKDSYSPRNVGIGEVAFRAAEVTPEPVPEPMTIFGLATTLGFGALVNRKNSKKQKNKDNN